MKSLFYSFLEKHCGLNKAVDCFASTLFWLLFAVSSQQMTGQVVVSDSLLLGENNANYETNESNEINANNAEGKKEWVALKNNLLYDAILTPNLSIETRLNDHWSLELTAGFNPFPLDDTRFPKWRHVLAYVQPKYWFCAPFSKHFLAFNAAYAHYNVSGGKFPLGYIYKPIMSSRYQGDAAMLGLSYGYHVPVSPHFSFEFEIGADGGYTWYDRFECKHCGKRIESGRGFFAVPKAGINLVVLLGGDKQSMQKRCDCEKEEPIEEPDTLYNTPAPIDTIVPEPVDTVIPEPIDTIVPESVDTVIPEPIDTIVSEPVDTIVSEPVDTVPVVPVVVDIETVEHEEQMQRLREGAFRPYSEYVPYTRDMVLSEDTNAIYLHFDVGVSKIVPDYMRNDEIMDSIMTILAEYLSNDTIEIRLIQIVGMASFDGTLAGNERLAQNRALALRNYIRSEYALPDSLFAICNGGEGWSELRWHAAKREFEGKDELLRIIETEKNLDLRERKIKQLHGGKVYKYLKENVTRFQRNAGNIIVFYEPKKSKQYKLTY